MCNRIGIRSTGAFGIATVLTGVGLVLSAVASDVRAQSSTGLAAELSATKIAPTGNNTSTTFTMGPTLKTLSSSAVTTGAPDPSLAGTETSAPALKNQTNR
jgi:hypothetical protein